MHHSPIASSSRIPSPIHWQAPLECQPFPTSSVRTEGYTLRGANPPCSPPRRTHATYSDGLGFLDSTAYSTKVPQRYQVAPGVWSDGTSIVFTADHPSVQTYLAEARSTLRLPENASEIVVALAALEVFYYPGMPVHWMFWSDEKKKETAALVNRISLQRPQLICSRRTRWNGELEYLSLLANVHGAGYRHLFENKDWYLVLVPPKTKSPKVPNLRKRKPAQVVMREASLSNVEEDIDEVIEPLRKRPKTKRVESAQRVVKTSHTQECHVEEIGLSSRETNLEFVEALPTPSLFPIDPRILSPIEQLSLQKPALEGVAPQIQNPVPQRASARQKQRRQASEQSPTPPLVLTHTSSSLSSELQTPPPTLHSRNRSTSQSSAETLVGCRPRSLSRLSAGTAVEVAASRKGKEPKVEGELEIELESTTEASQVVDVVLNSRVVTRARAARACSRVGPAAATAILVSKSNNTGDSGGNACISYPTDQGDQIRAEQPKGGKLPAPTRRKKGSRKA